MGVGLFFVLGFFRYVGDLCITVFSVRELAVLLVHSRRIHL